MEEMTDYQFKKLLEMVLEILKGSNDKDEAIKKIEALKEVYRKFLCQNDKDETIKKIEALIKK